MSTENITVAWVEATKEITIKIIDRMSASEVKAATVAETYKTIFQAVKDASTSK